jgi:uncharacterized protein
VHILNAESFPAGRWRNGGGWTRELFAWPAGEAWRLRVSLADIERDGPFSAFPGVQRHFAVVAGAGVCLRFAERTVPLTPLDGPLAFDGAETPHCALLAGPTRDLNLMLRGLRGGLQRAGSEAAPEAPWRALFCAGAARLHGLAEGPLQLPPLSLTVDLPAGLLRLQTLDEAPAYWLTCEALSA